MSSDDSNDAGGATVWHRVADLNELTDGSVKTVMAGKRPIALTYFEGKYGALDNTCPHMGGPLGQGEIEYGVLICPWHGREYHPLTGKCDGYEESVATFPIEVRDDGVYVAVNE
ncbi:MAG: Rieske (2Fe-2S) protein [Acidiferrobacterales bacterium]